MSAGERIARLEAEVKNLKGDLESLKTSLISITKAVHINHGGKKAIVATIGITLGLSGLFISALKLL